MSDTLPTAGGAKASAVIQLARWLFATPDNGRSTWSVIMWWEARRFAFNLIVGGVGFISLVLFMVLMSTPGILKPGEDAVEPMAIFIAPILMNIAYTLGWFIEVQWNWLHRGHTGRIGPVMLAVGFIFSLLLMLLPTTVGVISVISLHHGK
ncbi:hypothetical protein [Capsulimonas corticalis]|nr:hypothetical protein [Capsulimonas corticalis]